MKRCSILLFTAMAHFFSSSNSVAATYYVATNGLDSNPGTLAAPFRTIVRGTQSLVPGDTLYLRQGTYREVLQPAVSGTLASPIMIRSFSNEVVVISGADVVTAWSLYSNNIYQASMAWNLGEARNQVFVNGEMMHEARFPNFGDSDLLHPVLSTATISSPNNVATSADWSGMPANHWAGARFIGGIGSAWSHQTALVESSSGNSLTLTALSGQWFTGSGPAYLFGLMSMLDSDKEWYLNTNSNVLYLRVPGGGDPDDQLVEVKRRVFTVNLTNVSYITVQGLILRAGAVQMARGNGLALVDCEARFLTHLLKFSRGDTADIQNVWDRGVVLSSTNSTVQNCKIFDTATSGIYLDGRSNTIARCFLYNISYTGVNGAGINIRGRRHLIHFNTISNVGWAGFSPQNDSQTGHRIIYNDVTRIAEVTKDTGAFYAASGSNTERTRLAYNWFHDVFPWRQSGVLIYLDGTCVNNDIDHNVCWNETGRDSIQIAAAAHSDNLFNNTIFNARPMGINSTRIALTNNLYLSWAPETQLTDWQNHDFRLKPGAPAIDAGRVIPGVTDGYVGAAPDLGAYEFGGPYWVPGVEGWSVDQPGIRTDRPLTWNNVSATVQGTLMSAGTAPTTVRMYWGILDGGTNIANWPNAMSLGMHSTNPVVFTPQIAGLTPGAGYVYRFYATNMHGQYWGRAQTFTADGGIWISDNNASWGDSTRWQTGLIADGTDSAADFSTIDITGDRIVTLDSPRTLGAMRFGDATPSHSWTILGNATLTLSTLDPARVPSIEVLNGSATIGVSVTGSEGLEKLGFGTLVLTGENIYSGITLIRKGTLNVRGLLSESPVEVTADTVLVGSGQIVKEVVVKRGGTLSPGDGVGHAGTLTVSNLNLTGATLLFDFAAVTNAGAGINDMIDMSGGRLTLKGAVTVMPNLLDGCLTNRTYLLISNAASIDGDLGASFITPGIEVRFFTNSGAGPYNVFMSVSNVVGRDLVWRGGDGNVWDINTSSNWIERISGLTTVFNNKDRVRFDDSALNVTVALSGNLSPTSVVVENAGTDHYLFEGSGKITGSSSFTKSGNGTLTLKTANDYTGPTLIENGKLVFGISNALPPNTILTIGQSDSNRQSVATLDLSSASQQVRHLNIASLRLTSLINSSPDYIDATKITNRIIIGEGRNLTVNGNVVVGHTVLPYFLASYTRMEGGGSFNVLTNGGVFQLNGNDYPGSAGATETFMDMSALARANINLGASGTFYVGDRSSGGDGDSASILTLASNTTVTANGLSIGNGQRVELQTLKLGGGSNTFNVNTVQLGAARDFGQMYFNSTSGVFRLRAADGVGRATLTVGPNSGTTYGASNQFVDFRGHYSDLYLSALRVGEDNRGNSGVPYSSNFFGFSSGVVDTTTLRIGNRPGNPNSTPASWFNVCEIAGGAVMIGSGGIVMATSSGANGTNSTNAATLNVTKGSINVNGNVVMATQNASVGNNAVVSKFNIAGGTLDVHGNILCNVGAVNPALRFVSLTLDGTNAVLELNGRAIGGVNNAVSNSVQFIDQAHLRAGTIRNVGQLNGGSDLVKSGSGILTLSGEFHHTGMTVVSNGTLLLSALLSNSSVRVLSNATLKGEGFINKPVTVDGFLSPGNTLGTFNMADSLGLSAGSHTLLELNKAAAINDSVINLESIQYGGTLTVSNFAGTLTPGDKFILFSSSSYSGMFDAVHLPPLSGGLVWSNRLYLDGSFQVIGPPPLIGLERVNADTLTLFWDTNYQDGYFLQSQTNPVGAGLGTNWATVLGSQATNRITIPISSASGSVFYRLISP